MAEKQRVKSSADLLLEEIIVTARRREEHLLDQPSSIAAITGDQMEVQGIHSIDQAAEYVPNVAMVTAERANNTRVVIRGIGGGFPDPVFVYGSGMYIDGHYIPSSLGGYMSTVDIERIELLRGPQGTLFGKNVIGGLVNIISTKPHSDFDSSVTARLGEDGEQAIRAMVNVPFSETFFGRFSAASEQFDGYYHNRYLNIDSGSQDNKSGRVALRWVPDEHWTMDFSAAVSRKRDDNAGGQCLGDPIGDAPLWGGGAGNLERRLYAGAHADYLALCAADVAAGDFVNSSDKYTFSDVDEEIYQFGSVWDSNGALGGMDNLTISAKASYRNMEYRYFADRDYTSWPVDSVGTKGPKGQNNETWGIELLFESTVTDKLEVTFGMNYFDETAFNGENLCYPMFVEATANDPNASVLCPSVGLHFELVPDNYNSVIINPNQDPGLWPNAPRINGGGPGPFQSEVSVWNKSTGIFAHVNYDFNDRWTLDLGGRWTQDDRKFHNIEFASTGCDVGVDPSHHCNYTAPVDLALISDTGFYNHAAKKFEKFTPMASITRNLAPSDSMDQGMVYFLVSNGFLTGGFNTELNSNLPGTAPLLTYGPEVVWNYETGFKGQFMGGKIQLMADIFYMDYKDQQRSLQLANPDGQYGSEDPVEIVQNVASSKIYGLELEFRASLWKGGFLSADVGYLKNEYDSYIFDDPETPGGKIDNSDLLLSDYTPDWTVNLALEQEFELANGATITPRLSMYYQTGYEWATTGTWYKSDPHSACYQDAYSKFDGRITFRPSRGDWSIAAYGGNLTDERIIDYCASTRSVWNWRLQRPRFFGIEFSAHFGRTGSSPARTSPPPAPPPAAPAAAAPPPNPDLDGDGVPNERDKCPNTRPGAVVDLDGCEVEAVIALEGVHFDFDKATLRPEAIAILDKAAGLLKTQERVVVEVAGHTDSAGSEQYNQALSERRANAVKEYLQGQGITATRLTARGYGETQPVASNDTDEGRAMNRRVELIVLER